MAAAVLVVVEDLLIIKRACGEAVCGWGGEGGGCY